MRIHVPLALAALLTACGGANSPSTPTTAASPPGAAPAQSSDPAPAPAPTYNAFEGVWAGASFSAIPGYPALIVDGAGNYWSESINWMCGSNETLSGVVTATSMTAYQSTDEPQECHGSDQLAVSSIALSSGTLTLEGSLTGSDYENPNGSFGQDDPLAPPRTFAWLMSATSAASAPVSLAPGDYTTGWGGALTVGADDSFTLDDDIHGSTDNFNCIFTGQITQKDPATNVYSMTGTAQTSNGTQTVTVSGVFTVAADGQLQGGIWDTTIACVSVLDTQVPEPGT